MAKKKNAFVGRWRIIEMEMWDQDYVDLVVEGNFTFDNNGFGSFQFGVVVGEIDYKIEKVNNIERLEFSFEGQDEYDPVSGRGWATIEQETLKGKIIFHAGDKSEFKAKK